MVGLSTCIRPTQQRFLSVKELWLCQGFPSDFENPSEVDEILTDDPVFAQDLVLAEGLRRLLGYHNSSKDQNNDAVIGCNHPLRLMIDMISKLTFNFFNHDTSQL